MSKFEVFIFVGSALAFVTTHKVTSGIPRIFASSKFSQMTVGMSVGVVLGPICLLIATLLPAILYSNRTGDLRFYSHGASLFSQVWREALNSSANAVLFLGSASLAGCLGAVTQVVKQWIRPKWSIPERVDS